MNHKTAISRFVGLVVLLVAAMSLIACSAQSQAAVPGSSVPAEGSAITVIGEGTAYGEPDMAHVNVGVETFAESVSDATSQNEAIVQQMMATLTEMGISAEDIQTSNYNLWAEQRYSEEGPVGIVGYRVNNNVTVTIRDINMVGDVLGAVTEAGANSIHGVSFSVADPAALEAEARESAIADARAQAASLAELNGLSLGDVKLVSEVIGYSNIPPMGGGGMAMDMAESAVPSISPGQLTYNVQVQVTYSAE